MLTISNQLVAAPGRIRASCPRQEAQSGRLHHLSWSQIRTEALMEQANKSVSDPDQAWILAEFIRYLEHPKSGAIDFDDMGPSWVQVRERARTATLHPQDKGAGGRRRQVRVARFLRCHATVPQARHQGQTDGATCPAP